MSNPTHEDVRVRLERVEEVGTLPHVMARIMSIVQDESSTALDLAAEIAQDQGLTARLLKTVNSAYYAFDRQIMTVPEAVVLLGFNEVERLALAILIIDTLGLDRSSVTSLRMLWRHSLASSIAGSVLERRLEARGETFNGLHVACLLHDIGKALLAQHFPDALPRILKLTEEADKTQFEAEAAILHGATHCEIGALVARRWDLPQPLAACIAQHHNPEEAEEYETLVLATHTADYVVNALGLPSYTVKRLPPLSPKAQSFFSVDQALLDTVAAQLRKSENLLGAISGGAML